jgi:hypothetical protein
MQTETNSRIWTIATCITGVDGTIILTSSQPENETDNYPDFQLGNNIYSGPGKLDLPPYFTSEYLSKNKIWPLIVRMPIQGGNNDYLLI